MHTSDSEDFESADEGQDMEKNERKKRYSSSNYSNGAIDSDPKTDKKDAAVKSPQKPKTNQTPALDGWDDFDVAENELDSKLEPIEPPKEESTKSSNSSTTKVKYCGESQDTGWDDFCDWTADDVLDKNEKESSTLKPQPIAQEQDMKEVTDRLAAASTKSSGWGWGWGGVDSLLSTATAGISTLTNQVSQGISTVLETGIGAPDPEELAKMNAKEYEKPNTPNEEIEEEKDKETENLKGNVSDAPFPFGSLISGVTKFVETTGTKVIAGGLDTLETIGKKTMEVLQDGDPGLAKKRAMLGLDPGEKVVLSQVLREAKARAEEEDRIKEEKREAKEVHYENLFDDFEGLVHLEALEMLSRQVSMRIEERLRNANPEKRQEIKETLQQVAELCEMPEEEDEETEEVGGSKSDILLERLQTATQDIGVKLQFEPIVKQYAEVYTWLSSDSHTEKVVYKRAVSYLAQTTALSVEMYHKAAEMLLVKPRRSTADESDALTQLTVVLTKHVSEMASLFTEKLNSIPTDNKDQTNNYITNIFLEAGNSSTYIQNAFQLTLPILQIGAV